MSAAVFVFGLQAAAVASGMSAGFFLTFSDLVMKCLGQAETGAGVGVMQRINREVWRSISVAVLWGSLGIGVALAGYAYLFVRGEAVAWAVAGAAFLLVGGLVVSYAFNIPMNRRLDTMDCAGSQTDTYWHETYIPRWVFWNYVRAVSCVAAAACFMVAAASLPR